ncbi:dehydrodolichyl diphosphate synthase complex subunit Nus1 [Bombyx mori]|uniref:ditrans,polycis-polyprenyl diphosphate synthase [(2E,6E)-farnesyldiphosphate specific] n=1 Tax=Bombyx mori TaxID=7091 RepID=A0A8R1WRH4_BOMMO|nr:dehydrodolichyl diphosphate synthase complex subunit Nus1 [Bombyx mori]
MLSRLLRQFLFALLHLILNFIVGAQNVYCRYWLKKHSLQDYEVTKTDLKLIVKHIPKLSKQPKHLVVLSDSDYHSIDDLARMVIWSLVAGIPFLSFYDVSGQLSYQEEKLFNAVEKNKKGVPGCIKWSKKPDLNGYTNGIPAHKIVVNIFSCQNGRSTITQCIKEMCEEKIPYNRKSDQITAQEFDDVISAVYPSIPDPDLALFSGPVCCTHGLLPWQIRLTEFISLSVDYNLSVESFVGAMYKYSKCDQRFGT